jgi:ankyrin repeat protein
MYLHLSVCCSPQTGRTPLFFALRSGDIAKASYIAEHGKGVNARIKGVSLRNDDCNCQRRTRYCNMWTFPSDVGSRCQHQCNRTPLMLQMEDGDAATVQMLLELGADPTLTDHV